MFRLANEFMYQRLRNKSSKHKECDIMEMHFNEFIVETLLKKLDQLVEKQWSRKTNTIIYHLEEFQILCSSRAQNEIK